MFDPYGKVASLPIGATIRGSACPLVDNRTMLKPWRIIATDDCSLFGTDG
ncbi:hypothetical protein [Acidisphaera sp. L21]|nr:hypothetical protein [Acidisphaera sp. L21]